MAKYYRFMTGFFPRALGVLLLCLAGTILPLAAQKSIAASLDSIRVMPWPLLKKGPDGRLFQLIALDIVQRGQPVKLQVRFNGKVCTNETLLKGANHFRIPVPAVDKPVTGLLRLEIPGTAPVERKITLRPVVPRTIYLISHSHNDIGYSDLQTVVEHQQNDFTREALSLIAKTKDYPQGAQFKWNIESLWALENFFRVASDSTRQALITAVRKGYIGLSAGYCNELTGVSRPEELYHLLDYSRQLQRKFGIGAKTYMISDVPGFNWSAVSVFASRGVRYISSGPNYSDRIGYARQVWDNKPFYWVSSSGADTVLYWQAGKGYSFFHNWIAGPVGPNTIYYLARYMHELDTSRYPYDMVQMRYTIVGDNHGPDPNLPDFVREWNTTYASPKLVIATVDSMMIRFEKKYGNRLPVYRGDFTPYWADGVMSSAWEEGIARRSVERLIQASILDSLDPRRQDSALFYHAWRNAVMWHEHTWGAWCSISHPDSSFTSTQWTYKRAFALGLDSLSKRLLGQWIPEGNADAAHTYEVVNTSKWMRSGLVRLDPAQSATGDGMIDSKGNPCPAQRLRNGDLVFWAADIPAFGTKTYRNIKNPAPTSSKVHVAGNILENGYLKVVLDPRTGSMIHLVDKRTGKDFVDSSARIGLNEYLYVPGRDPRQMEKTANVDIEVGEKGPLVASLVVTSEAPGTSGLRQQITLIGGVPVVKIANTLDKKLVRSKESVHFAFPLSVADGQIRVDLGNEVMRPDRNQLPGSNRDFACMDRWIDVTNDRLGMAVASVESPLVEIGSLVNEVPGQGGVKEWKRKTDLKDGFYFYVMNNYWHTNYRAGQQGRVTFHYALFPHGSFDRTFCMRKGAETCQPLLVRPLGKRTR